MGLDFSVRTFSQRNLYTCMRYDLPRVSYDRIRQSCNPRTYIRYNTDIVPDYIRMRSVSTHVPVKDTTACLLKALFITFSANDSANNDIRQ